MPGAGDGTVNETNKVLAFRADILVCGETGDTQVNEKENNKTTSDRGSRLDRAIREDFSKVAVFNTKGQKRLPRQRERREPRF